MIIVWTTVSDSDEAQRLARLAVEAKLAACVQILPPMTSVYVWEGAVKSEQEQLLMFKTLDEKYSELESFIRENHSYDVPEIVAIAAEKVSESYLAWMNESLG